MLGLAVVHPTMIPARILVLADSLKQIAHLPKTLSDSRVSVLCEPIACLSESTLRESDLDGVVVRSDSSTIQAVLDGIGVLRRGAPSIPILVAFEHHSIDDVLLCLDAGADDSIGLPLSGDELLIRVLAVQRRRRDRSLPGSGVIRFGHLEANKKTLDVWFEGEPLALSKRDRVVMLELLKLAPGSVTRKQLIHVITKGAYEIGINAFQASISRLRVKLKKYGIEIHSTPGVGYRLQ
jgi:DNA-binding response OmpR family regulator